VTGMAERWRDERVVFHEVADAGTVASRGARLLDSLDRRQKTSVSVARDIVADIVARDLRPGDHLPLEAAMVDSYRVGRASLREALRLLEVQGLIELRPGPGGGPAVGVVDSRYLARTTALYLHLAGASYRELFEAYLMLQPLAAETAARHPDRDYVRRVMDPFGGDDHPLEGVAWHTSTFRFHRTIEALGNNRVVNLVTQTVGHIMIDHVLGELDPVALRPRIAVDHRTIAAAVAAGDADEAHRAMRAHYQQLSDYCQQEWPDRFEGLIQWR
jgi:GntR family transcriptional regulator, transcriptional repressor for pyruvate dehydrogenase complex